MQKNDKKIFNKKFSLLTLDFRIAVLASKIEKNIYFLEKHLTYYFQHDNSETSKKFKFLNKNWFNRRLQAFNFYSDNYKMSLNLDYIITRLVNILF